jgi:hypothetical protein
MIVGPDEVRRIAANWRNAPLRSAGDCRFNDYLAWRA